MRVPFGGRMAEVHHEHSDTPTAPLPELGNSPGTDPLLEMAVCGAAGTNTSNIQGTPLAVSTQHKLRRSPLGHRFGVKSPKEGTGRHVYMLSQPNRIGSRAIHGC
jgi:hypothetical protein